MKALLVNFSSPEMDRLAVELVRRDALAGLVRRYANKQRGWERRLARLPAIGKAYAATMGRRFPPSGLNGSNIIEAGVVSDFAGAILNRLVRRFPGAIRGINQTLHGATQRAIARMGERHVTSATVIVANYHVAWPAFRTARMLGKRTVLNYPIAHHRWQYRCYAEQAEKFPEFAPALPRFSDIDGHAAELDREIALADVILVGSTFVRETFIREGIPPGKLRVIQYGADPGRFNTPARRNATANPFRILFVGQIGERKGVSHLLKGYRTFRKKDTELHLVGNFVDGSEVYAPYRGLFRHTLHVPQAKLPDLFHAADVFVLPTLVEGMPMVVLEAMACGLPVIVTSHGPADVVREGIDGYVVPVCDSNAIADRLERLYADSELRTWMGSNAAQQARQWTWTRYSSRAADAVLSGGA